MLPALLCLHSAPAVAVDTAGAVTDEGIVIRVTSGRIAAPAVPTTAVTVVEPAAREGGPGDGLGEVLEGVPGVFAASRENAAQDLRLSIRGFGARGNFGVRGIRIYLDGFPLTLPDGQSTLDDIDPGSLGRAEVRRGLSSTLYGGAAGGVILLESTDPREAAPWSIGLGDGRYGSREFRLGLAGTVDAGGIAGEASRRESDGYRDQSARRHDRAGLRFALRSRADTRWFGTLNLLDSPYAEDPGGLTDAERDADPRAAAPLNRLYDAGERVRQQRLGLRVERTLAADTELRLAGYVLGRDFDNRLPFSATELERTAGGASFELEHGGQGASDAWRWVVGADLDLQRDRRARYLNLLGDRGAQTARQDEAVDALGVFVLGRWRVSPDVDLEAGLRYDRVEIDFDDRFLEDGDDSGRRSFDQWSPSLGFGWRTGEAGQVFARLATAFETPTTTELANPSGAGGFNPAAEPQRATGVELGWRWGSAARAVELALYDTRVSDQLVPVPITGQPGRFWYENAGESRYRGVEVDAALALVGPWSLELAGSLARLRFVRFRNAQGERFDGNRIPGVPERQASARLRYGGGRGLDAALAWHWVGPRYADNANTVEEDAYDVVRLGFGHTWRDRGWKWRLGAGVDNLFDTRYTDNLRINAANGRYFEPAPDRTWFLTLAVEGAP